jgi:hypothetical protein
MARFPLQQVPQMDPRRVAVARHHGQRKHQLSSHFHTVRIIDLVPAMSCVLEVPPSGSNLNIRLKASIGYREQQNFREELV